MENFLSILFYLACPVGMGLMMWVMMRGSASQEAAPQPAAAQSAEATPPPTVTATGGILGFRTSASAWTSRLSGLGMCLNWKVLGGLALLGVAVWIAAPGLVWGILPLLLLAACPLSMLLMMRGMRGGQCSTQPTPEQAPTVEQSMPPRQIETLKAELAAMQARQESIARQIAQLETDSPPATPPALQLAPVDGEAGERKVSGATPEELVAPIADRRLRAP